MMKVYSFTQAKALLDPMPAADIWEKVKRDITHLPQDARDAIYEWRDMYEQYSTGQGVTDTIRNTFKDAALQTLKDIWDFVYQNFYWVALFGGLGIILLYVCGHRDSLKWIWTLVVGYVVICALGTVI